jgi:hypothetical protein
MRSRAMPTSPLGTAAQYERLRVVEQARQLVQGSRRTLQTSEVLLQESHAVVERSRRIIRWSAYRLKNSLPCR